MQKDLKKFKYKCAELDDLVGERTLTAVDCCDDEESIMFTLDGVMFRTQIDADDGYRSYMDKLEIITDIGDAIDQRFVNNIPPVQVTCTLQTEGEHEGSSDWVLKLRDTKSNLVILRIGTIDIDDYYPGYLQEWLPQNIHYNRQDNNESKTSEEG